MHADECNQAIEGHLAGRKLMLPDTYGSPFQLAVSDCAYASVTAMIRRMERAITCGLVSSLYISCIAQLNFSLDRSWSKLLVTIANCQCLPPALRQRHGLEWCSGGFFCCARWRSATWCVKSHVHPFKIAWSLSCYKLQMKPQSYCCIMKLITSALVRTCRTCQKH